MKTYKKITEEPKLEIFHDDFSGSPRNSMSNLGYMTIVSNKYVSPNPDFLETVKSTGNVAKSSKEHIELIKAELETDGVDVLYIYPLTTYEHGNRSFSLGSGFGFDYSNNGFYIVTKELAEEITDDLTEDNIKTIIEDELETYASWGNGEVYRFVLYDNDGEVVDQMGGFYDLDSIKGCLPSEWKNEDLEEYVK